jgi:hypothetical protein
MSSSNANTPSRAARRRQRKKRANDALTVTRQPAQQRLQLNTAVRSSVPFTLVSFGSDTKVYLNSLADPFDAPPGKVVIHPVMFSRSAKYWIKGTFTCGATHAFVVFSPELMVANNAAAVNHSTTASAGSTIQLNPVAGVGFDSSNSDYPAASFGAGPAFAQFRLVSAGLRIRYIGTELNKGGECVGLHQPNHGTLDGQNIPGLLAHREARKKPVSPKVWTTILWRPVDNQDFDFKQQVLPAVYGVSDNYMGFILAPPSAPGDFRFEYEAVSNFEIVGRDVHSKTLSGSDPLGFAAAHAAVQSAPHLVSPHQESADTVKKQLHAAAASVATSQMTSVQKHPAKDTGFFSHFDWAGIANKVLPTVGSLIGGALGLL